MKKVCLLLAAAGLMCVSTASATLLRENFGTDPALDGWQVFGETNLFQWDATNHVLDATWDSSQGNNYYYHLLDRTYTIEDGFFFRFNFQLTDLQANNSGLELAVGLLHWADATNASFSRANFDSPNVCEFDYFPYFTYPGGFSPDQVNAVMIDGSGYDLFYDYHDMSLVPGVIYQVAIVHQPGAGSISCEISTNGQVISTLPQWLDYGPIGDFQLDMLSINSYADGGPGSPDILAHGTVGNFAFASPLPIGNVQTPGAAQAAFGSDTNWVYTLEGSTDFQTWTAAAAGVFGNGTNLLLQATNPPAGAAFYRVRADLP